MKLHRRTLHLFLLILITAMLTGLTWTGNTIAWNFLLLWDSKNYDGDGIPKPSTGYIFNVTKFNHPSFVNYILATLPEGKDQSGSTALFASSNARNLFIDKAKITDPKTAVYVSFISESSLYRNSLGYFLFDAANPPTSKTDNARIIAEGIVFPNASYFNSGGSPFGLRSGNSVYIDLTPAMSSAATTIGVGFFLVNDGFSATTGVRTSAVPQGIFHTIPGLNTETAPLNEHSVLLKSPDTTGPAVGLIALALEESNRMAGMGSDHDFNDVVYGLSVTPDTAIVNGTTQGTTVYPAIYPFVTPIPDDDGDGVPNGQDEFPNDGQRATSTWHPSKTGWNTLAYEDLWASAGDYDLNDLVVNYRYQHIYNSQGKIKEIRVTYQLMASGAGYTNGFAVEFTVDPNYVPAPVFQAATLQRNNDPAIGVVPVTNKVNNNVNLVFTVFANAKVEFNGSGAGFVNTVKNVKPLTGNIFKLNVTLKDPVDSIAFTYAPLHNPFLFRSAGLEVHLPGYPPTDNADANKFGTLDDNTSNAAKRYFVSKKGYPWALDIPQGWKWPIENTDIVKAYPNFRDWVQSSGTKSMNWYLTNNPDLVYP